MDNSLQDTRQPISDDQELAKALAGISNEPDPVAPETPQALPQMPSQMPGAPMPGDFSTETDPPASLPQPSAPPMPTPSLPPVPAQEPVADAASGGSLDDIKKNALNDLRPLVDRVSMSPEEKFDVYLMLIRSTDDTSLIDPAYAAAQGIEDEKKKAEALLDVIKEIDYLSKKDDKQQ